MKATFEFSLPEETPEYGIYHNAPEYISALREFREWLRQQRKHGDITVLGRTYLEGLEEVWDKFHEVCEGFIDDL